MRVPDRAKKIVNVTVGSDTMELEFDADAPQDWIDECVRTVRREMRERQMRVMQNAAEKAQVPA